MKSLTIKRIEQLHKKYSPGKKAFTLIFTHSQIVRDISFQCVKEKKLNIEKKLLEPGAMLHDIGVYKHISPDGMILEKNYITHGIDGERILLNEGLDQKVARFCSHHTGVGISKEEIDKRNLPLPLADYFAQSTEEKLVMYADKFHSKSNKFKTFTSALQSLAKFGPEHEKKFLDFSKMFGVPSLEYISSKYKHPVV